MIKPTGRDKNDFFLSKFCSQANNVNNDGDVNTSDSDNTITNTGNTVTVNNNRRRRRSLNYLLRVLR